MEQLQHRLAEESPVMTAGEGLNENQRKLIREREIGEQIKQLKAEQDTIRQELLAEYEQTGDDFSNGAYKLAPYKKESHTYDEDKIMLLMDDVYRVCLKFDAKSFETVAGKRAAEFRETTEKLIWHVAKEEN